ncbi:NADH dehydrogenase subunit 2 [Chryseobacterium sp. JV274]|nr:NADH dehydrogenase subunit 2 [Chryseobacterium sp. JV274]
MIFSISYSISFSDNAYLKIIFIPLIIKYLNKIEFLINSRDTGFIKIYFFIYHILFNLKYFIYFYFTYKFLIKKI